MAGACILGCAGPVLDAAEARFFARSDPWGFILFARNVESPSQLRRLTGDLRDSVGRDAPILVDQEGGRVARLRAPHWREWPTPLEDAEAGGPARLRLRFAAIAAELRAVGIDTDCAPVADVATADTHPFLRNRCLGTDAAAVAANARAVAEGLLAGGCLPVVKHLPGHGRAVADSHATLPHVAPTLDVLDATDFAAFRALADMPMGMTGHVVYDAIDADAPATTSPRIIAMIRNRIGFDGVLMTDDLSMGALAAAVPGDVGARAAAALGAGCDLALHCNGNRAEMAAVVEASGPLRGPARARAARALSARAARAALPDPDACAAAYDAAVRAAPPAAPGTAP